jgi:Zn-dependent protease
MDGGFSIGRFFGIQFRIHYSWFVVFTLLLVFLSLRVFPNALENQTNLIYWLMGTIASFLFFTSILFHEVAHSLVCKANGIPVKDITLFIFGGAANMTRESENPKAEFKLALAGPLASLGAASLFFLGWLGFRSGTPQLGLVCLWLGQINLIVAAFNLLPGFPLDGGRIFRSIIWYKTNDYRKATRVATRIGQLCGYLVIAGGLVVAIYYREWLAGLWLVFIGWFLADAAKAINKQMKLRGILSNYSAAEAMRTDFVILPANTRVQDIKSLHPELSQDTLYLITENDQPKGIFSFNKYGKGKTDSNPKLGEVMASFGGVKVDRNQNALSLVQIMNEKDIDQVVVVKGSSVEGIITISDLIRLTETKEAIKK